MPATSKELNEMFKKNSNFKESKIDKKIQALLKKELTPIEIFKKIKEEPNIEELSRFLYNAGLEKTLLQFSARRLKNEKPVAWAYILKVLIKYNIHPEKKLEKLLFHYWLKNKESQPLALFACEQWGNVSPEFQQMSLVYLQNLEERNLSKEKELLEQLAFVQAQELVPEEEDIISKLLTINPENTDYKLLKKNLEEKKAVLTVQEQKKALKKRNRFENYNFKAEFSIDELQKDWLTPIFNIANKNKKQTKNLAFFLYFCDSPVKALELLETHINQLSDYWFYLEWCFETKQYTKGLELIHQLSLKANNKLVPSLPLIYIKAQFLYYLGQKSLAIEYLQNISQFKPGYKSTEYLLSKWSQEK